ncbi:fimbrial protein [Salmonella enterica]|nr:fimbrial protein [Salmonella enterica]
MKKTLIALAVAASAAVSGSAMAWTANGTGGSVDLGGSLTPVDKVTPWETKVGKPVSDLDAQIQKGQTTVDITVRTAIPILGIRTIESTPFQGRAGVTPQINFGNAVNLDAFNGGRAPLTLEVKGANDAKIGTLTSSLSAGSETSYSNMNGAEKFLTIAERPGDAFWGGLPKSVNAMHDNPWQLVNNISSEFVQNYNDQNGVVGESGRDVFDKPSCLYSSFYGSGIEQGQTIKITLDRPASGNDQIHWKASLPVIVTYA